jgi:protein disulfide-isomerase A6
MYLNFRYEIQGFPTLKFFPAGSAEPEPYEGPREVESMVEFINKKAGTQRQADGSLMRHAGRVYSLDKIIESHSFAVTEPLLKALEDGTKGLTGKEIVYGKDYLSTASKILNKGGADYVAKEMKRLEGMISGGSLIPEKKSAFQLRYNVLSAFVKVVSSDSESA